MSRRLVGLLALSALTALAALPGLAVTSRYGAAASAAPTTRPAARAVAIHPPLPGTLWITNYGDDSLLSFAPAASGDVKPIAQVAGSRTELSDPAGVAIDTRGRIWVANHATSRITVYGPLANGNAEPLFSIAGAKTHLDNPLGLAITRAGNLWVASSNSLLEFGPGKHGNVPPIRVISGPATGITAAAGLAVTLSGKHVWVANFLPAAGGTPSLEEFSTTARGNVAPWVRIAGSRTTLDDPYGIAVGVSGNTPVTDNEDQPKSAFSLLRFADGTTGNKAPTHVVAGSRTGLATPTLLAINASGAIWVPNYVSNVVQRFDTGAHGNVRPTLTLSGPETGLNDPLGIADYITAPSAPRSVTATVSKHRLRLHWKSPAIHGGGIVGYRIRHAAHRSGPWTILTTTSTIGTSYLTAHATGGYYRIQAYNNAGFSRQTAPRKLPG